MKISIFTIVNLYCGTMQHVGNSCRSVFKGIVIRSFIGILVIILYIVMILAVICSSFEDSYFSHLCLDIFIV